ncbi:hypothetical protein V6Z11_D01G047000 [Gossypium hirsutum]
MDPYIVTFHLGLGMGVIEPSFYISFVVWDPIHLFSFLLLLNREINRHPLDTSKRSKDKYSNTPPLSYIPYITLDRYHIVTPQNSGLEVWGYMFKGQCVG